MNRLLAIESLSIIRPVEGGSVTGNHRRKLGAWGSPNLAVAPPQKHRTYNFNVLYCNCLLAFNIFSPLKTKVEIVPMRGTYDK